MRYVTTRSRGVAKSFSECLLEGLAPDGGLYLPEAYPAISPAELQRWRSLDYPALAFEIVSRFAPEIPQEHLRVLLAETYSTARFRDPAITPLKTLAPDLYLLQLSNGPTLAFKDIALQLLAALFEWRLGETGTSLNILGATSGDTGSAAECAMLGKHRIRVFMLSPKGRMSAFQRAQMYSLNDKAIFNLAIEGTFDDCQAIVKSVSGDAAFKSAMQIGTVNSINWARLMAQVVYYFKGYFAATERNGEEVAFAVPSGNFGNVCAGHVARQMGLPIQLIVATNENDVLDEFFRTGAYRPRAAAETYETSSPSMDISKASNFERFVFDLVGRNPARVTELWAEIENGGGFTLAGTPEFDAIGRFGFTSGSSTHDDRLRTIADMWQRHGVEIDPHTADGIKVGLEQRAPGMKLICLETALPIKFEQMMVEALGRKPYRDPSLIGIEDRPQYVTEMPADAALVKAFIRSHAG